MAAQHRHARAGHDSWMAQGMLGHEFRQSLEDIDLGHGSYTIQTWFIHDSDIVQTWFRHG